MPKRQLNKSTGKLKGYPGALSAGREFTRLVVDIGSIRGAAQKANVSPSYVTSILRATHTRQMWRVFRTRRGYNFLLRAIENLRKKEPPPPPPEEPQIVTWPIGEPSIEIDFVSRALAEAMLRAGGQDRHRKLMQRVPDVYNWINEVAGDARGYFFVVWDGPSVHWNIIAYDGENLPDPSILDWRPFARLNALYPITGLERNLP